MQEILTMSAELTERRKNLMSGLSSVVKGHPLITFFVLVYALAWIIETPASLGGVGWPALRPE